jgi:hypothetical protein
MIDSKTGFLLKWAEFEKLRQTNKDAEVFAKSETEWITVRIDLTGFFYVRDTETKNFHESTPEAINKDLQNFLKKYMRENGIEPPPKLSRAQERILIREINGEYQMVTFRQAEDLCTKGIMDGSFLPKLTAKGRIMAEYLKEKV